MRALRLALAFALLWIGSAQAQMNSFFPGPGTAHSTGGGGGSLTFTWRSSTFAGGTPAPNASMFTSQAIGPASSDRFVAVCVAWVGTSSPNMDIPAGGVTIGGVTATQAVYNRSGSRAHAIYYANVPTGTTATIGITGYSNGFIDEIIINSASITGSATTSSANTDTTAAYPNGLSATPSITVPSNGVSVICELAIANGGTTTPTWSNATGDNTQWDGNVFGAGSSMAHLTTSATVQETSVSGGGPTGWVLSGFQP